MVRRRRRGFISHSNDESINADMPGYAVYDYDDNVELFLSDVRSRNRSTDTIKYYKQSLTEFRNILNGQGVSSRVDRLTKRIIQRNFIEYSMTKLGHKYGTVANRLRAVRAFFNFLVSEKILKESPMQGIVISNTQSRIETYSREQLNEIFRQPDLETFVGYRDYTIMTVLLDTGVRLRELVDIETADVRMEDNQILIDGKNGEFRLVPFSKTTKKVLRKYIDVRGHSPSSALFITQDDGKMARKTVQERITKYGRMAGISDVRNSPHTFRHTFAKMSVRNGANVFELQKILGHKTLDMVRVYVNLFSSEVLDAHRKFSPVDNLHLRN